MRMVGVVATAREVMPALQRDGRLDYASQLVNELHFEGT